MTDITVTPLAVNSGEVVARALEAVRGVPGIYMLGAQKGSSSRSTIVVGHGADVAKELRRRLDVNDGKAGTAYIVRAGALESSELAHLEAAIVGWLMADGRFAVTNDSPTAVAGSSGTGTEAAGHLDELFRALRDAGLVHGARAELEDTNVFRFSPFKALNELQLEAARELLDDFFDELADPEPQRSTGVILGQPGTGKTVIAVTIFKVLAAIRDLTDEDLTRVGASRAADDPWAPYMTAAHRGLLRSPSGSTPFRMGFVVPQQSLRETLKAVFRQTKGLDPKVVMSAFDLGNANEKFDFLVIDEAHRLQVRHAMPNGGLFKKFSEISTSVAERIDSDDPSTLHQLHWVMALSRFRIFMLDPRQSVRTNDLPRDVIRKLATASRGRNVYALTQQMRVRAAGDYVSYIRSMFDSRPADDGQASNAPDHGQLGHYDFRLYDDPAELYRDVLAKDDEYGLSRLSAGYAWKWASKNQLGDDAPYDIEIGTLRMRWNRQALDWINSPTSRFEVGSIHTLQGYDLNWAGVIIGPDIRLDPGTGRIVFDRHSHFDPTNRKSGGRSLDDIRQLVVSAYEVLMTRGVHGTYVYICDVALREHLRPYFPVQKRADGVTSIGIPGSADAAPTGRL